MLNNALERHQLDLCCKHNLEIHWTANWLGIMLVCVLAYVVFVVSDRG